MEYPWVIGFVMLLLATAGECDQLQPTNTGTPSGKFLILILIIQSIGKVWRAGYVHFSWRQFVVKRTGMSGFYGGDGGGELTENEYLIIFSISRSQISNNMRITLSYKKYQYRGIMKFQYHGLWSYSIIVENLIFYDDSVFHCTRIVCTNDINCFS